MNSVFLQIGRTHKGGRTSPLRARPPGKRYCVLYVYASESNILKALLKKVGDRMCL